MTPQNLDCIVAYGALVLFSVITEDIPTVVGSLLKYKTHRTRAGNLEILQLCPIRKDIYCFCMLLVCCNGV